MADLKTFINPDNNILVEHAEVNFCERESLLYCAAGFMASQNEKGPLLFHVEHEKQGYLICVHIIDSATQYGGSNKSFLLFLPMVCMAKYGDYTPRVGIPPDSKEVYLPLIRCQSGSLQAFFQGLIAGCLEEAKNVS